MAYMPSMFGETAPCADGSLVLSRYQAFGPDGLISSGSIDELIAEADICQSPKMATVTGWIALESAFAVSKHRPNANWHAIDAS